jgi:hypothetical protein
MMRDLASRPRGLKGDKTSCRDTEDSGWLPAPPSVISSGQTEVGKAVVFKDYHRAASE